MVVTKLKYLQRTESVYLGRNTGKECVFVLYNDNDNDNVQSIQKDDDALSQFDLLVTIDIIIVTTDIFQIKKRSHFLFSQWQSPSQRMTTQFSLLRRPTMSVTTYGIVQVSRSCLFCCDLLGTLGHSRLKSEDIQNVTKDFVRNSPICRNPILV